LHDGGERLDLPQCEILQHLPPVCHPPAQVNGPDNSLNRITRQFTDKLAPAKTSAVMCNKGQYCTLRATQISVYIVIYPAPPPSRSSIFSPPVLRRIAAFPIQILKMLDL
jgi:hypothetical protein